MRVINFIKVGQKFVSLCFALTKSSERFFSSTMQLVLPGVYAARSTQKWFLSHKTQPQSIEDQITEEHVCGRIKQRI
jgi:hypothetical protein